MLKPLKVVFGVVLAVMFVGTVFAESVDTAWVRTYNGPTDGSDRAYSIAIDNSGNVYLTGLSRGSGTSDDIATIKYHPNGDTVWVVRYNGLGNSNDCGNAIAVDSSCHVYVSGSSVGIGASDDYCTIKYTKTTGVEDETGDNEKPTEFALSQNYPNPFNPATAIRFKVEGQRLKVPIPTTQKIYNILGEVVKTLVNEAKLPGNYMVQWDGKNDKEEQLASGIYFYELKVGDNISAKKMVLLKYSKLVRGVCSGRDWTPARIGIWQVLKIMPKFKIKLIPFVRSYTVSKFEWTQWSV